MRNLKQCLVHRKNVINVSYYITIRKSGDIMRATRYKMIMHGLLFKNY